MKTRDRTLLNIAGTFAVIGIAALMILLQGCSSVTERKPFISSVNGKSMYPNIKHGDIVAVTPKRAEDVEIGEVVVFTGNRRNGWSTSMKIAHRVIGRGLKRGWLITKGDNNDIVDYGYVTNENLLGVVSGHFPQTK